MEQDRPASDGAVSVPQRLARATASYVSGAVLMREAARTSRRWQTYFVRTAFSGVSLAVLLLGIRAAVTTTALVDAANLAWLGRGLFVAFSVTQMLLALLAAPLTAAAAMAEETEERTLELLVLTPLKPAQILAAKLGSRALGLATVVLGALPVTALVVNLGGVSVVEVVTVTLGALTTVIVGTALGGFFALFTRSPALATLASAAYALPAYVLLPALYAMCTAGVADTARFSPFAAGAAEDATAWLLPLSFAPSVAVIFGLTVPLFRQRVSGAAIHHAFSDEIWRTGRWAALLAAWIGLALIVGVPAVAVLWWRTFAHPTAAWTLPLRFAADAWVWAMFSAGAALLTWAFLRVGMDVVDGLDGILGNQPIVPVTERSSATVWSWPVLWREARPRTWAATSGPLLLAWGLALVGVFQTGFWIVPGGLLGVGALNAGAAVVLSCWLAARSVAEERRQDTLESLLATTVRPGSVALGKLAGALLPTSPLVAVSLPLLTLGVPQLHLFDAATGSFDGGSWLLRGVLTWVWLVPVWLLAAVLGAVAATRMRRPESAFGLVSGGLAALYAACAVAGRALTDLPLAAPAALVAPPLAGGAPWQYAVSIAGTAAVAGSLLALWVVRLRRWVGLVAAALLALAAPTPAPAAPPDADAIAALERQNALRMVARPLADGIARDGSLTALAAHLENQGAATTGVATLTELENDGSSVIWTRTLDLPERAVLDAPLVFRPTSAAAERVLELVTADGRRALAPFALQAASSDDVVVCVIGPDALGLPAALVDADAGPVPGRQPRRDASANRAVRVGQCPVVDLPRHSAALSGIDWLVWPAADPTRASAGQLAAVRDYVADGGHLLIAATDTWRQVAGSGLADVIPVELDGLVDADVGPVRVALGDRFADPAVVPIARSHPRAGRSPVVRARAASGEPVWLSDEYGLGSVHLLLADPRSEAVALRGRGSAWRRLLSLPAPGTTATDVLGDVEPDRVGGMLNLARPDDGSEGTWETVVRRRLSTVEGVSPVPQGWLVAFALLYLLAIGPVDYAILRALRRQPWTWVTYPALIALFTAGSLAMTSRAKGSRAALTRVEVVDDLPGTGLQRGQTWIGLFSARKGRPSVRSGREDGVVVRPMVPGFQPDPRLSAGDGPGGLAWNAETWTLSYARSDWVGPAEGGLEIAQDGEGWKVVNRYAFALDAVALTVPSPDGRTVAGWVDLGGPLAPGAATALPAGDTPEAVARALPDGDAPLEWALRTLSSRFPTARGTLRPESRPIVVGVAARPVEPLEVTGIDVAAATANTLLVVRRPVPEPIRPAVDFDTGALNVELDPTDRAAELELRCGDAPVPPAHRDPAGLRFEGIGEGCTLRVRTAYPPASYAVAPGERWTCLPAGAEGTKCTRTGP